MHESPRTIASALRVWFVPSNVTGFGKIHMQCENTDFIVTFDSYINTLKVHVNG